MHTKREIDIASELEKKNTKSNFIKKKNKNTNFFRNIFLEKESSNKKLKNNIKLNYYYVCLIKTTKIYRYISNRS
jgi:hypothetical protein